MAAFARSAWHSHSLPKRQVGRWSIQAARLRCPAFAKAYLPRGVRFQSEIWHNLHHSELIRGPLADEHSQVQLPLRSTKTFVSLSGLAGGAKVVGFASSFGTITELTSLSDCVAACLQMLSSPGRHCSTPSPDIENLEMSIY